MSGGAGVYPGGYGPAGADPTVSTFAPRAKRPVAIRYEGRTADWAKDANGNYRAVTSVEQGFALALCTKQGDIKSSPTTGNTLHEIEYVNKQTLAAELNDRVRQSNPIARFLADGSAVIVRIAHEAMPGGFKVAVYFKDLTADKNRVLQSDASVR